MRGRIRSSSGMRGKTTVQLMTRHWVIVDANGKIEEIKGLVREGAIPVSSPSGSWSYESGTRIATVEVWLDAADGATLLRRSMQTAAACRAQAAARALSRAQGGSRSRATGCRRRCRARGPSTQPMADGCLRRRFIRRIVYSLARLQSWRHATTICASTPF